MVLRLQSPQRTFSLGHSGGGTDPARSLRGQTEGARCAFPLRGARFPRQPQSRSHLPRKAACSSPSPTTDGGGHSGAAEPAAPTGYIAPRWAGGLSERHLHSAARCGVGRGLSPLPAAILTPPSSAGRAGAARGPSPQGDVAPLGLRLHTVPGRNEEARA